MAASPTASLFAAWRRLAPLPGGRRLFAFLLGRAVPYTGSVHPYVELLEPGRARVRMRDRRRVRNHLNSVHAIALVNLAEVASGLAMLCGLPPTVRGIVVGIDTEYLKKARGTLVAEATVEVPTVTAPVEHVVTSEVFDAAGDVVARARVRWRLSPVAAGGA